MTRTLLPILLIAVGVGLMATMIFAEGEPGAIPLLIILVGALWYGAGRVRTRPRREEA